MVVSMASCHMLLLAAAQPTLIEIDTDTSLYDKANIKLKVLITIIVAINDINVIIVLVLHRDPGIRTLSPGCTTPVRRNKH